MERNQITMMTAAILMAGRTDMKVGEAVHFASQIESCVLARERKSRPPWANIAADLLEISNSKVPEVKTTSDSEE